MIIAHIAGTSAIGLALRPPIAWLLPSPITIPGPRWGIAPPETREISRELLEELLTRAPHIVALGALILVLVLAAGALAVVGLWALFVPGARKLGGRALSSARPRRSSG